MILPFISSLGRDTTLTVFSVAWSAAQRCIAVTIMFCASLTVGCRAFLDVLEERVLEFQFGFLFGHSRHSFEFTAESLLRAVEFFFYALQSFAAVLERLLGFFQFLGLFVEGLFLFGQTVLALVKRGLFLQQTIVRTLPFRFLFSGFAFKFGTQFILLLFCLEKPVLANCFGFQTRFFEDTLRLSLCQAYFVFGIRSIPEQSRNGARK